MALEEGQAAPTRTDEAKFGEAPLAQTVAAAAAMRLGYLGPAGTFTHADKAGANSFHFTGRVRRRKLAPGSYRLQAVPRANGKNGKAVTVSFRIVK